MGDGVANDTAAIQATIDASLIPAFLENRYHGKIFFPPGEYKVTSSLIVRKGLSGGRSIIFEGCGSSSFIFGNFAGFIFTNDFTESNGGVTGFRDLAVSNSATTLGSGAIQWPNVLLAFYHGLDLNGFCALDTCGPLEGANFSPSIDNCNFVGINISHLANSVGIRLRSGGGGQITNCVIRGFNHGVRGNSGLIANCDIENNMLGIGVGLDALPTRVFTSPNPADLDTAGNNHFLGGGMEIRACSFEANAMAIYVTGHAEIAAGIIGDAFCSPLSDLLGNTTMTGNATNSSAIITNISPNTTGAFKGAFFAHIGGSTYIIQSVDSATQITLSSNFTGTTGNKTFSAAQIAQHGIKVRFGNAAVFSGSIGGPFSVAAIELVNPGSDIFYRCDYQNTSSGPTWIIPHSFKQTFIGDFTFSTGVNPPNSAIAGTFANLPTVPKEGDRYSITNCNTVVFRAIAAGGGADHVEVRWDGTNWRVSG